MKFKYLPEVNKVGFQSQGKCWVALDSPEKASKALADLGDQFEINDQMVKMKLSDTSKEADEKRT